ncbi:MAG: hypothetical protein JNL24_14390 [Bacteroidia bacterium]|nr:hypothetical protein [Bacteroidia bacterium]
MEFAHCVNSPNQIDSNDFESILKLIVKGGQVNSQNLSHRLRRADLIAYSKIANSIVACAVLKNPNPNYKLNVFEKSQSINSPNEFSLELGYVFTDSNHRGNGFSSILCNKIVNSKPNANIFATTNVENLPMQKILQKNGFFQSGKEYIGDYNDKLVLLIKNN